MIASDSIDFKSRVKLLTYRNLYMPIKARYVRMKKQISVVFVVSELGVWKTESLYMAMLRHPRFSPKIAVVDSLENPDAKKIVIDYMQRNGYEYSNVGADELISKYYKADIIFYQKPYWWVIPEKQNLRHNYSSLFCYVNYAISTLKEKWAINQQVQLYAWQNYQFNKSCCEEYKSISLINGRNYVVTGFPMTDSFVNYHPGNYPWKELPGKYKRIIWAPHHSIPKEGNWIDYSTFLEYSNVMLEIAQKYKDSIQFAFKPHPLLRPKLERYWGKDKSDAYFAKWREMNNTQLAEGEYVDLFMQSDAMIHDCGSFTIEYIYANKPVMYLENGKDHTYNMLSYAKEAYDLHYKGTCISDVELFVQNVINNVDPLKERRIAFIDKALVPPTGNACYNIIDSILGIKSS